LFSHPLGFTASLIAYRPLPKTSFTFRSKEKNYTKYALKTPLNSTSLSHHSPPCFGCAQHITSTNSAVAKHKTGFWKWPYMKTHFLASLCLLLMSFLSVRLQAQSQFTLSGYIYEEGSKESLPGAVIYSATSQASTVTNNYGFYSITLPAGEHEMIFQLVGYVTQDKKVNLNSNTTLPIYLVNNALMTEVVVSAEAKEKISEDSRMSTIEIPVEQIKSIPALFGEKDVLKVIQLMPGVQKGSEGSSGFYVRGGGPDQNLIILDDATVYNANHLFGFFSLFNGDAIKSIELTKGGFPARYGGRLSSVLELQMKDGNKEKLTGEVGIGLISSRFRLEGPVKKGVSSFLVSGRRTYIDALIYPFLKEEKFGYFFYDFNAKYHHIINENNRLFVSGYFGKDKFYYRSANDEESPFRSSLRWGNATMTARWNHLFNEKLFANTSIIFTDFQLNINLQESDDDQKVFSLDYGSGIRDYSAKIDFDFHPNPKHYVRWGAIATAHHFTPKALVIEDVGLDTPIEDIHVLNSFESGIYAEDDWSINKRLKINVGMRLSYYNTENKNYLRPEPRFSGRFMLNELSSFKASFAMMNQYIHLLSNTGVGLPTDLWVPATRRISPQSSTQYALGYAQDIPQRKITVTFEAYYKNMKDIIHYREGANFLNGDGDGSEEFNWENQVTSGIGDSYGAELMVQRKVGKFTGWIGYTLSWTKLKFEELNFGKAFYARYDRRHDISLVGIYKLNDRIQLAATWVYGTGQAITLPLASYSLQTHQIDPNSNSYYGPIYAEYYGDKNSFRMAAYHRFDITAQFKKQLKRVERTFELGFYNLYNRKNPYFYMITNDVQGNNKLTQISLFPILPSFAWTYKF
jgi:TonB dependent receptor/CarboxypepD_reg-like domain/TonB-dependent Receptor Plug Domain